MCFGDDEKNEIEEIESKLEGRGYEKQDDGSWKDSDGNKITIGSSEGSIHLEAAHVDEKFGRDSEKANKDAKESVENTLLNTKSWETGPQYGEKTTHFHDSHRGPTVTITRNSKNDK